MPEHRLSKVEEFLKLQAVKFRSIQKEYLPLAPSSRLKPGTTAIPGSNSHFNHVLFLSEGAKNSLLVVVYSKNTLYSVSQFPQLESIALTLNEEDNIGFWRIEVRSDRAFPIFEVNLYTQLQVSNDNFVWKSLGDIDKHYLELIERFDIKKETNLQNVAKVFLQRLGFKRIKETAVVDGISYIVILSNEDMNESDPLKQFPLKLTVTSEMVTFQIFFSYGSAVVTANKAFASSVLYLLAEINNRLSIGYLDLMSSGQIHLSLNFPTNETTCENFDGYLKTYYDQLVAGYLQLVRALGALYCDSRNCNREVEDVREYLNLLSEDLQVREVWQYLDYTQRQSEYLMTVNRLRTIENSELGVRYCLSNFFQEVAEECRIQVKTNCEYMALREYVRKRGFGYSEIAAKLETLMEEFAQIGVFPTIEMVFCSNSNPMQLLIFPTTEFHNTAEEMTAEFTEFAVSLLRENEIERKHMSGSLFSISFSSFEAVEFDHSFGLFHGKLAGDDFYLHPVSSEGVTKSSLGQMRAYQSLIGSDVSAIVGLTCLSLEAIEEFDIDEEMCVCELSSTFPLPPSCYDSMKIDILKAVQTLYNSKGFHWFLSPVTIRCKRTDGNVALVLPCAQRSMAEWRLSIVSERMRKYVAPEVVRFAMDGKEVEDAEKADVFSICQILLEHSQRNLRCTNKAFFDLLTLGISKNPLLRPTLSGLIGAL